MYTALIARLRRRLAAPLPGAAAHLMMAPATRRSPGSLSIEGKACREGAVLLLLFPVGEAPALLLTLRHGGLRHHAGQISLPGGRREAGESLPSAALREAHEETALPPEAVELLGSLSPLYIPPSNFCVHPFVGAAPARPALHPSASEVEALLEVPVAHLLEEAVRREEVRVLQGAPVRVPYFAFEEHRIWGATAMILAEFLTVWQEL